MKLKNKARNFIFVSGTGRSGTHLIGRSIASHPSIQGRIEDPYTFRILTKLATTQDFNSFLVNYFLKKLLFYRLNKVNKGLISDVLEKSHPSLWLMEDLLKNIHNSKFIGVYRAIEPTVNSMLNHKGVLNWYNKLPQNRVNRFLGITEDNREDFKNYSLEKKCSLRWSSHVKRLTELKEKFPDKILCIDYDDFIEDSSLWLRKISDFLEVENNFDPERFHVESRDKWKISLTQQQLWEINQVKSEHDKYFNNTL